MWRRVRESTNSSFSDFDPPQASFSDFDPPQASFSDFDPPQASLSVGGPTAFGSSGSKFGGGKFGGGRGGGGRGNRGGMFGGSSGGGSDRGSKFGGGGGRKFGASSKFNNGTGFGTRFLNNLDTGNTRFSYSHNRFTAAVLDDAKRENTASSNSLHKDSQERSSTPRMRTPTPPASILSPVQQSDAQPDTARADDEKQDAHHSNNQNNQESLKLEIDRLNKEVSNLRGHNLQLFSMEQLVALQQTLLDSIQNVNKHIHQKQNDFQQCRICFDRNKCVLIQPCNHLATCQECSDRIEKCPICLSEIQATIIAFL